MAFMLEERRHINAEALQQALRDRGEEMSLSTVYLNLGVLVEVGLLREFKGAQGESVYDATTEPHDHLICKETGEVIDVPLPTIDGDLLPLYLKRYVEQVTGWQVDEVRLSLLGRPPRR
jgi:Fur family peroxide stress response transcriptional regulator